MSVTVIPDAVYKALSRGDITAEQFDIYAYSYHEAERPAFMVHSYSAGLVCQFRRIDATEANVKRYERAAADLLYRHLIRRNYYKIDTKRFPKRKRTYNLWVPAPSRFQVVGSPEENEVSLWEANVGLLVGDNVGLLIDETPNTTGRYTEEDTDNVGLFVGLNANTMSIKDQENQNREIDSPLPPEGVSTPPALVPRERSDATGLLESTPTPAPKAADSRKPLSPEQCADLSAAALRYADFIHDVYSFLPEKKSTTALLRIFSPDELLYAHVRKFPPYDRFDKRTMNHFYEGHGAEMLIQAARLNKTSKSLPKKYMEDFKNSAGGNWEEFPLKWQSVLDAWQKVFGGNIENGFQGTVSTNLKTKCL